MDDADRALLEGWCASELGWRLEPTATRRIERFLDLLVEWNRRLRLTGERDPSSLVRRHVADALGCVSVLPDEGSVLDLGTGAGFPGLVLACVRTDLDVLLLDSRERPAAFLAEVVRMIPVPRAHVLTMRAEDAALDQRIAARQILVTSRAVRLEDFLRLAKPLLAAGGRAVSMQTPRTDPERAESLARRCGYESVEVHDYRLPDGDSRRLVIAR